ncbi:MAG TPA: FTR1 family protein [Mycobacteriales bacterium]|nr:FTR1 family protein [Mycobacteriales bacterium]
MVAAFVIFLREGVEASMIVAIILAYLNRIGRRDLFRDIAIGVGVALGLAALAGVAVYLTIRTYADTRVQSIVEACTYLSAAAVLTYMTFWMRSHARHLSAELRGRVDSAVSGRTRIGLSVLAGQAVGREGVETAVFTLAIAFSTSRARLLGGGLAGLLVALAIAFVIYRLGHRINLARFFSTVGTLLTLFAAGLLVDAVENFQRLGWLPFLTRPLWHSGSVLRETTTLGDVLHSFFGYAESPTLLQVLTYAGYAAVVVALFLRRPRAAASGA